MIVTPKLFLYSLHLSQNQYLALANLVGKRPEDIHIAMIENAADIIPDSESWLKSIRQSYLNEGFQVEPIDLRLFLNQRLSLFDKLSDSDVVFIGGGHTYYLRWILYQSKADVIIQQLVQQGKVYAGWSAGAVVSGPTIQFFDSMGDDPEDAPKLILQGLNLQTQTVVPHLDNPDFKSGAEITCQKLIEAGFEIGPLNDDQVLIVTGDSRRII